ncbi:hypothetical protein QJS10_CPA05g00897 [Acorus calamus]|uniref:Uncharacterized protein n=1 Tax=Acorus calamus TaxID=4465 RepID=A0AAV9EUB3_ACOCL|nr:hypothetical protein QJS10_CPA05g00897 [Acorus calamus]
MGSDCGGSGNCNDVKNREESRVLTTTSAAAVQWQGRELCSLDLHHHHPPHQALIIG